jgi:hypothetical protein
MQAMRRCFGEHPEVHPALIGGEIVLTGVTAQAVQSRIMHRFEDFEQTRHAAAAVWDRINRGDLQIDVGEGVYCVDDAIETPDAVSVPGASRAERRRAESRTSSPPDAGGNSCRVWRYGNTTRRRAASGNGRADDRARRGRPARGRGAWVGRLPAIGPSWWPTC